MIPDTVFTLAAAKGHLRVFHAEEDALITAMLDAAVERCEQYTGLAWTERQDIKLQVPFGCYFTNLPIAFVKDGTMVLEYLKDDNTIQPYPAGTWVVRSNAQGGQFILLRSIPTDISPDASSYAVVTYTAAMVVTTPPPAVVQAAMLYLGDLYANRESQIVGTIVSPNKTADALLDPHRITWGV